jgi:hypothetical protein
MYLFKDSKGIRVISFESYRSENLLTIFTNFAEARLKKREEVCFVIANNRGGVDRLFIHVHLPLGFPYTLGRGHQGALDYIVKFVQLICR